ncbi:ABC transporter transmembrane domain-containing protein [Coralliovum pocilloporae]|uniref:ABC transporter transmembrane domain-containing protein n=1 Tax=Coralliovum pocilloporae TaxID=3066369 RepID=UPI003307773F
MTLIRLPRKVRNLWFAKLVKIPLSIKFSSLFINILGLVMPLVILQVYDRIVPNQALGTFFYLIAGTTTAIVLDAVMKTVRANMIGWSATHFDYAASQDALSRVLSAQSRTIEKDIPSLHIDRMNALTSLAAAYGGQARLLVIDLPFIFLYLGLMAFIGGQLVLVSLGLFCVFAIVSVKRSEALQAAESERRTLDHRKSDFIIECLSGIETIKTMACEPQMQRRYERLQRTHAGNSLHSIDLDGTSQSLNGLMSSLSMVLIASVGGAMVIGQNLSLGALAACLLLGGRTVEIFVRALRVWGELQNLTIVREHVEELFTLPAPSEPTQLDQDKLEGSLSLKSMSFRHEGAETDLFKSLDLEMEPGTIIGIRGSDHCGRTTLLRIMRGEIKPTSGSSHLDGFDAAEVFNSALRQNVCFVPRNPTIFNGTILDNITMFRGGDSLERAREATQLLGLEADINRLPDGYDTQMAQGVREALPASFIQRVAIARALATRPKVLLFNESNSMLDQGGDTKLRNALLQLKGDMTMVLISNRPSFLAIADRVYMLEDGNLSLLEDRTTVVPQQVEQAS